MIVGCYCNDLEVVDPAAATDLTCDTIYCHLQIHMF